MVNEKSIQNKIDNLTKELESLKLELECSKKESLVEEIIHFFSIHDLIPQDIKEKVLDLLTPDKGVAEYTLALSFYKKLLERLGELEKKKVDYNNAEQGFENICNVIRST